MTSLLSLTNYPKWQCQIGGGYVGQWWMPLVSSQSKGILLLLLINEPEKRRFRREMGPFVSFFLPPLSSPFSFFFKTNTGVAWEQIIAACITASLCRFPADQRSAADGKWWNFRKRLEQGGLQRTEFPVEKDLTYILTVGDLHKHLTLRRRTGNAVQLDRK